MKLASAQIISGASRLIYGVARHNWACWCSESGRPTRAESPGAGGVAACPPPSDISARRGKEHHDRIMGPVMGPHAGRGRRRTSFGLGGSGFVRRCSCRASGIVIARVAVNSQRNHCPRMTAHPNYLSYRQYHPADDVRQMGGQPRAMSTIIAQSADSRWGIANHRPSANHDR
jgi:hypothetical protein